MNYTELKAHIIAHTDREDIADSIDTFIEQAVSEINLDVRCGEMMVRATSDVSTQFTNLPEDILEVVNVQNNDDYGSPIKRISRDEADTVRFEWGGVADKPKYYTIARRSLELVPVPDSTYEIGITYFQKVTIPSVDVATNAMLDQYPQLFIIGALKHAYDFLKEKDEYSDKAMKFEQEKEKVNLSFRKSAFGDGALHIRRKSYG